MINSISIIIVNWNSGLLLRECMSSILDQAALGDFAPEIIVVDNASIDGSATDLPGASCTIILANTVNKGFGAACNQGAAVASGEYFLFLNPDCRVAPGSIEKARRALLDDPGLGVSGVALHDDSGTITRSCQCFPQLHHLFGLATGLAKLFPTIYDSALSQWPHDNDRDVDHVIGAFYMIRPKLFRDLEGFDERFFVYLEDLDLSLRVAQAGYRTRFIAQPSSYHKGGGTSEKARTMRIVYAAQSRILYAFKHFGGAGAWVHFITTILAEPFFRIAFLAARGRGSEFGEVIRAFAVLLKTALTTLRRARSST